MKGLWNEPLFSMEDHDEAYIEWKSAGIQQAHVLHLDAHLDLSDEYIEEKTMEKILAACSRESLENLRSPLWDIGSGLDPGNYLYPALRDGTMNALSWVIPDHMVSGDFLTFLRTELTKWVDLTLPEYDSLKQADDGIHGRLKGAAFSASMLKQMKALDAPFLLDIDLDFLLDMNDCVWMPPHNLAAILRDTITAPLMTTVAYSVSGGYTPREHRYLGDVLVDLLQGKSTFSPSRIECVLEGDRLIASGRFDEAGKCYSASLDCLHLRPALCVKMARIAREWRGDSNSALRWEERAVEADRITTIPADSAAVQDELPGMMESLDLFNDAIGTLEGYFVDRDMSRIVLAVELLKNATEKVDQSQRSLEQAAEASEKIVCIKCHHYNNRYFALFEKCCAKLPQAADVTRTSFQMSDEEPLSTDEGFITDNLKGLYDAVNAIAENAITDQEFLETIEWMRNLLELADGRLAETPRINAGSAPADQEMTVPEEVNMVDATIDNLAEGIIEFRKGLDILQSFIDSRNREVLIEGIRVTYAGARQLYAVQMIGETTKANG